MCSSRLPLLLLASILSVLRYTEALTFNVTKSLQFNNSAWHGNPHEAESANCTVPYQCFGAPFTVPGNTLWYWCGFYATHRSYVNIQTTNASTSTAPYRNLTTFLVREDQLNCMLSNLTYAGNCTTLPAFPPCDTLPTCSQRAFGLAYEDPICLVVMNNKQSATGAIIQYVNCYDSPRYYGTCFSIVIAIFFLIPFIGVFAYRIRREWRSPLHKLEHADMLKSNSLKLLSQPLVDPSSTADVADSSPVGTRITSQVVGAAYVDGWTRFQQKLTGLFSPGRQGQE